MCKSQLQIKTTLSILVKRPAFELVTIFEIYLYYKAFHIKKLVPFQNGDRVKSWPYQNAEAFMDMSNLRVKTISPVQTTILCI